MNRSGWTSKPVGASDMNCSDDDERPNRGENRMALSHQLVSYVGRAIFHVQKHTSVQMPGRVNGLEPLEQAEISITTCISCMHKPFHPTFCQIFQPEMTPIGFFLPPWHGQKYRAKDKRWRCFRDGTKKLRLERFEGVKKNALPGF